MCGIVKIHMHFSPITWYIYMYKMYTCVHLGKILKNEGFFFLFGQSMKKMIMVIVGYSCVKEMMIWHNVVIFPFH